MMKLLSTVVAITLVGMTGAASQEGQSPLCGIKNEAVDIHMPAASENVNLKFNTYENNEDSSSRDDELFYFNKSNIVSGVVCIFVMAHKPIPISFTLAPSR